MDEADRFDSKLYLDVTRNAFLCADRVAEILSRLPPRQEGYPKKVLLDLKAIAQIGVWEDAGLNAKLPKDLPSAKEALVGMANQLKNNPKKYLKGKPITELQIRVNEVFIDIYAMQELTAFRTSYMTTPQFSREQLKIIADCLWDLRHLATRKRGTHDLPIQEVCEGIPAKKQRKTRKLPGVATPVGKVRSQKIRPRH